MEAIANAARDGDRSALRRIIESLDSDDPAIRMLAISTLQRLTGQTMDYRPYDPPAQRQAAVERWVQAMQNGSLEVQSPGSARSSGMLAPEMGRSLKRASPGENAAEAPHG